MNCWQFVPALMGHYQNAFLHFSKAALYVDVGLYLFKEKETNVTEQVKINLNLSTGEVAIDAPASALDSIFDRLELFLPKLVSDFESNVGKRREPSPEIGASVDDDEEAEAEEKTLPKEDEYKKSPKKRASKSSSAKPQSYKTVDLGLSPEQRADFKGFYESKAPRTQNDHVLVVIYWLLKNTDRERLTVDEIFTGLRTVGERIPKRITSVLSNLSIGSYITKENNEPTLLHIGEDYVDHDLPKKNEGGK